MEIKIEKKQEQHEQWDICVTYHFCVTKYCWCNTCTNRFNYSVYIWALCSPSDSVWCFAACSRPANVEGKQQTIHLWQFLKELLVHPKNLSNCIKWVDQKEGIFKIEDSARVAKLWGQRKNRPAMNYDKLSRSIRQYYKKGIIKKTTHSKRLVYQFCQPFLWGGRCVASILHDSAHCRKSLNQQWRGCWRCGATMDLVRSLVFERELWWHWLNFGDLGWTLVTLRES